MFTKQFFVSTKTKAFWPAVALFALVIVVYGGVFRAGFIWDDNLMVYENDVIKASDGLWKIWFSTKTDDYFPLTFSSF